MEVKLYHKNQRELAKEITRIIDFYWDNNINQLEMERHIFELYKSNKNLLIKEKKITTIIIQQCGKRRTEIIKKILEENNVEIY